MVLVQVFFQVQLDPIMVCKIAENFFAGPRGRFLSLAAYCRIGDEYRLARAAAPNPVDVIAGGANHQDFGIKPHRPFARGKPAVRTRIPSCGFC